jgi:hypothetical protein
VDVQGYGRVQASLQAFHVEQAVQVHTLAVQRLAGREGQQAVSHAGSACYSLTAHVQHAVQAIAAALMQAPFNQLEAAANAGEQVVEVMRNPPGQLANGVHLACLVAGEIVAFLFILL